MTSIPRSEVEAAHLAAAQLEAGIDRSGGRRACHLWRRGHTKKGYGTLKVGGRKGRACQPHRLIWILHHGAAIPPKVCICHSCDTPACCNPGHLFLGTYSQNNQDCVNKRRWRAYGAGLDRTHCVNGHPYNEQNTYTRSDGKRQCRVCTCESQRRYQQRRVMV